MKLKWVVKFFKSAWVAFIMFWAFIFHVLSEALLKHGNRIIEKEYDNNKGVYTHD